MSGAEIVRAFDRPHGRDGEANAESGRGRMGRPSRYTHADVAEMRKLRLFDRWGWTAIGDRFGCDRTTARYHADRDFRQRRQDSMRRYGKEARNEK